MIWVFIILAYFNEVMYIKPQQKVNEINIIDHVFGKIIQNKSYNVKVLLPPKDNAYGCFILPPIKNKKDDLPSVWLLKEGNCSLIVKSNLIKLSGAFASFVYLDKNIDKISDKGIPENNKINTSAILFLNNKDGKKMSHIVQNGETIIYLDLNFEYKKKIVNFEYFLNPSKIDSYELLLNLSEDINNFKNNIVFEPKYRFKNIYYNNESQETEYIKKYCIYNGTYCLDNDKYKFSINEYYSEAVYQKCIYLKTYKHLRKTYWNYIDYYFNKCFKKFKNLKDCREKNFERFSKESKFKINKCYEKSFVVPENYTGDNWLLHEDMKNYNYKDLFLVPAVFINTQLFKIRYTKNNILKKICNSFKFKINYCQNITNLNIKNINSEDIFSIIIHNWKYLTLFLTAILIFILAIVLLSRFIIQNRIRKSITVELEDILKSYVKVRHKSWTKKNSINIVTESEMNLNIMKTEK